MPKRKTFDLAPVLAERGPSYVSILYELQEAIRTAVLKSGVEGLTSTQLTEQLLGFADKVDTIHVNQIIYYLVEGLQLRRTLKDEVPVFTSGRRALVDGGLPIPRPALANKRARLNAASTSYRLCELVLRQPDKVIYEREAYVAFLESKSILEAYNPSRIAALVKAALTRGYLVRSRSEDYKGKAKLKPGHHVYTLGPKFNEVAHLFGATPDSKADIHRLFLEISRQVDTGNSQQVTLRMSKLTARWLLNKFKQEIKLMENANDHAS